VGYILYYNLYFFWDIIPLSLIMWYHYISFKSQIPTTASAEDEEDEQSEEEEEEVSERQSTMSSQRSDSFASSTHDQTTDNSINQSLILSQ